MVSAKGVQKSPWLALLRKLLGEVWGHTICTNLWEPAWASVLPSLL